MREQGAFFSEVAIPSVQECNTDAIEDFFTYVYQWIPDAIAETM